MTYLNPNKRTLFIKGLKISNYSAVPAKAEPKDIMWTSNYTQSHTAHRSICALTSKHMYNKL